MSDPREVLTWSDFGSAVDDLAAVIVADGYEPDVVLSIARGGLGLGMGLGYALGVKEHATINVEFYTGVDARLPAPVELAPVLDPASLAGRAVLIVDDVADTGLTLRHVRDEVCAGLVTQVRTAVVYEKPRSVVRPDYAWRRTDAWIDFPWSTSPALGRSRAG